MTEAPSRQRRLTPCQEARANSKGDGNPRRSFSWQRCLEAENAAALGDGEPKPNVGKSIFYNPRPNHPATLLEPTERAGSCRRLTRISFNRLSSGFDEIASALLAPVGSKSYAGSLGHRVTCVSNDILDLFKSARLVKKISAIAKTSATSCHSARDSLEPAKGTGRIACDALLASNIELQRRGI
jgi:hypothetical protein